MRGRIDIFFVFHGPSSLLLSYANGGNEACVGDVIVASIESAGMPGYIVLGPTIVKLSLISEFAFEQKRNAGANHTGCTAYVGTVGEVGPLDARFQLSSLQT